MTKTVFKVVKFLELFLIVKIGERNKKLDIAIMDIFQTRKEATAKKQMYDFIGKRTSAELKKIIAEKEAEGI